MATFNYAARDYDTIKTDLLARAERVMPEWTDRDSSDFGMLLVDLWSAMGDVLHYYADRAATEAFLETATQRESVLSIANLLDYTPEGRAQATGTVTVANANADPYTIARDTSFIARHNEETYYVHARSGQTIPGGSNLAILVGEGRIVEDEVLTESASVLPGQRYPVADAGCAASTIRLEVYENGITPVSYAYVTDLATTEAGARQIV